jgi:hypothetical protein
MIYLILTICILVIISQAITMSMCNNKLKLAKDVCELKDFHISHTEEIIECQNKLIKKQEEHLISLMGIVEANQYK